MTETGIQWIKSQVKYCCQKRQKENTGGNFLELFLKGCSTGGFPHGALVYPNKNASGISVDLFWTGLMSCLLIIPKTMYCVVGYGTYYNNFKSWSANRWYK